jgi:hypothetical protein
MAEARKKLWRAVIAGEVATADAGASGHKGNPEIWRLKDEDQEMTLVSGERLAETLTLGSAQLAQAIAAEEFERLVTIACAKMKGPPPDLGFRARMRSVILTVLSYRDSATPTPAISGAQVEVTDLRNFVLFVLQHYADQNMGHEAFRVAVYRAALQAARVTR